jgi:predicted nucleic acid-binding protein
MKAIADTGFLVAFLNRNDHHHAWALEIAERITEPLLTCDTVLAEAALHLGSASLVRTSRTCA